MSRAAIKTEPTSTLHSEEQKHLLYKAGTLLPTNTLLSNMASSLLRQNRKTFWLKAPRSMKHEESLRYRRRTDCYSGKHAVIQRPHTSGGKCLGGKSVFVNDMGQLFWGRLDLCTHLQASSLNLGRGFVFHGALPLLIHSDLPLLLWVIQSSLDGNLFTLCSACQIVDIGGGREVISLCTYSNVLFSPHQTQLYYTVSCSLKAISTAYWFLSAYCMCIAAFCIVPLPRLRLCVGMCWYACIAFIK